MKMMFMSLNLNGCFCRSIKVELLDRYQLQSDYEYMIFLQVLKETKDVKCSRNKRHFKKNPY